MKILRICRTTMLLAAIGACTAGTTDITVEGEDTLGIARFTVDESADKSTVIGYATNGVEVGRMELTHGRFQVSSQFQDDYPGSTVIDGRKLVATINGQSLHWETAGYDPVLDMPGHPAGNSALATFLDAPNVKAVLERWQIGFEAYDYGNVFDLEQPYGGGTGSIRGDSPLNCSGQSTCGTAYNGVVINTCGGSSAAISARRVTQHAGTNCGLYSASIEQHVVSQCCPVDANNSFPWFAYKYCPTTSNTATACGTAKGACKGCAVYDATSSCSLTQGASVGTCGAKTVVPVNYAWTNPNAVVLTVQASCDFIAGGLQGSKSLYVNGTPVTCYWTTGPSYAERSFTFPPGTTVTVTRDSVSGLDTTFAWTAGCTGTGTSCTKTLTVDNTTVAGTFSRDNGM